VEERVGDIQLMSRPLLGCNNGEDGADPGRLDDGGESFPEVDVGSLYVAAYDPRSRLPSAWYLILKTHLPEITRAPDGCGTRVHVLLARRASYSTCMAATQFGSLRAARTDVGTGEIGAVVAIAYLGFGLMTPALARVTMGCADGGAVGCGGVAGAGSEP
jgi:hypothetical protein